MADNIAVAGESIATDSVEVYGTTAQVQRIKLGHGDNNTYTADVSVTSPLPANGFINTSTMQSGLVQLTPKFKYTNITADADVVAAVTGKKIRVLAVHIDEQDSTADVVFAIKDSSSGSVLAEFSSFDVSGAQPLPFSPVGWFETTAGNALYGDVIAGTTPDLNICVVYVEV